jgi:hypothetical protein
MSLFSTYDAVGIKEDISDVISDISPTKTPFLSLIGTEKTQNRTFQWQEDTLAAPRDNAQLEGFTAASATLTPTTLRSNNTQIFEKTIRVSATEDAVSQYGRAKETAYQLVKGAKELKRDVERAYVGVAQAAVTGDETVTARRSASAFNMIAAGLIIDAGTAAALAEANLLAAAQAAYNAGGEPTIFMIKPADATKVAGFAAASGRNRDFRNESKLVNVVDLYVSPFGEFKVVLNRWLETSRALLFDPDQWSNVVLRNWTREPLAKTGDNTLTLMVGEMGLKHKNFSSCASIIDLQTT